MHRKITATCIAILVCLSLAGPTFAQSMPKEKQAEVAFELRLDQMRASDLYKMAQSNIEQMAEQADIPEQIDLEKVNRVFFVMALPETMGDMEALNDMEDGADLPVEFMATVEFADSMALTEAMDLLKEQSDTVEMNGKTWMKPKEGSEGPGNMMAGKQDDTTMVIGTEGYLKAGGFEGVLSKGLAESWEAAPDEPLRLAFDLDNARDLIDELIAEGKANDQSGMAGGFLDLLNKTRSIRLSMDVKDGGNILTFGMTGTNDEAAEDVRKGIDGMLGMAKMMGGGAVEDMKSQNEEMGAALETMMNALAATREGDKIQIAIPKPANLEKALESMMGGGGDF